MKKILLLLVLLSVLGCKNTDYNNSMREGYKTSVKDSRIQVKKASNKTYYKAKNSEGNYLMVERDVESKKIGAILNLEYIGENWIYMEGAEFIGPNKTVDIKFLEKKFKGALIEEKPGVSGDVEERVAFKITEEQLLSLKEVVENNDVTVRYYTRYKNRNSEKKLTNEEIINLRVMINLYKKATKGRE